ncbi:14638_t:CDS:2 [Dentiscutata heterogama]|uniref:14638_t:CDS:1 n=1 Tax=Dentiscutata heterogama TaxID=1316150 RepID=A0ACA9KE32_9GLOM|nr:14638_t:CDS:2 [Dentiscutata heterogama]
MELFYMLPYQRRKNNWFPELIFDNLYDIVTKIQDNNWNKTIKKLFLSNSLLKIIHIGKTETENKTIDEKIQQLTDNENKIIQKLDDSEKIIQELKKILLKEVD